jgi:NAD(P)-dependent dehydrogenase (short-subunit alcohol dehydrogenase family)
MTLNPMDLTGRHVLVTGASSGLGRATAVLMSRLGARLSLLGRDTARLKQTLDGLEGEGHETLSFDLSHSEQIPEMLAQQAAQIGPFAGLVHSAGAAQTRPLRVSRPQDFEDLYRLHVVAASQLLRGLAKRGVTDERGCAAVVVASDMSLIGLPGLAAYAASKAGVLGLVRCAALELARFRIRVNAVLPGHFVGESQMDSDLRKQVPAAQVSRLEDAYPLGFGRAADVANVIAFLVADTSRWMTGSSVVVDGGHSIQ